MTNGPYIIGCGGRTRTYDLWVMSPTSCQLLHSAMLFFGAEDRNRTGTRGKSRRILSPVRLPVPPLRHTTWLRPTLPGGRPPSTIGAKELNFCVRNGNRCILFAIITTLFFCLILDKYNINTFIISCQYFSFFRVSTLKTAYHLEIHHLNIGQVLDLLVSIS